MIRKHAFTLLGIALLVGSSGYAARAHAFDVVQTPTIEDQDCERDGGWYVPALGICEIEAP